MDDIRIMLVDSQKIMCDLLQLAFKQIEDISVIGVADNGKEALQKINQLLPDMVLLDVNFPDMSGLEITKRITQRYPDSKVVILTSEAGVQKCKNLLRAGVHGYILKKESFDALLKAMKAIYHGKQYISPDISSEVALTSINEEEMPFDCLSNKEFEVMQMVIKGDNAKKIAENLDLSPKTVHTYRSRIHEKLAVNNDMGVILKAIECGIINV